MGLECERFLGYTLHVGLGYDIKNTSRFMRLGLFTLIGGKITYE
jgi:hypothetical protein